MKKKLLLSIILFAITLSTTACNPLSSMKDGFYTAEMSEFSHGWKEYVCILVKNDKIVSAEFNAKNESGFIKAWDNNYMQNMKAEQGTYPNDYTRKYVEQLINEQMDIQVDAVTGASHSGGNFEKLVKAVIEQAKSGDSSIVEVAE